MGEIDVAHNLSSVSTLMDVLYQRASTQPEQGIYTYLLDGETSEVQLTYEELALRACQIGLYLQEMIPVGERVLLLYPPGLDFISAFYGCLYAVVVAVPVYPPDPMNLSRTLPRLQSIIQVAKVTVVKWCPSDISGQTPAFLQYISGSTGKPKSVILTHHNLLDNLFHIHNCFGQSDSSKGAIWLPPYHDMGLIGGILQPLYGGFPVVLISPLDFLQRPFRWLQAISKYRATYNDPQKLDHDLRWIVV